MMQINKIRKNYYTYNSKKIILEKQIFVIS